MEKLNAQERLTALRRAGLTEREIDRLCRFRRTYIANPLDWSMEELARLQFARWLIANDRLTEYPEEDKKALLVPLTR